MGFSDDQQPDVNIDDFMLLQHKPSALLEFCFMNCRASITTGGLTPFDHLWGCQTDCFRAVRLIALLQLFGCQVVRLIASKLSDCLPYSWVIQWCLVHTTLTPTLEILHLCDRPWDWLCQLASGPLQYAYVCVYEKFLMFICLLNYCHLTQLGESHYLGHFGFTIQFRVGERGSGIKLWLSYNYDCDVISWYWWND